jgi:two-component system chemotaxis sensor kinase CheA
MSGFEGMEDLLQDFLVEAGELLAGVDNKLVDLEQSPGDHKLLNEIFRGFHTIKGGAGFLNATELVTLCHLTENLFDKLRNNQMTLTPEIMDVIMSATAGVRSHVRHALSGGMQPGAADPGVIAALKQVLAGETVAPRSPPRSCRRSGASQVPIGTPCSRPSRPGRRLVPAPTPASPCPSATMSPAPSRSR